MRAEEIQVVNGHLQDVFPRVHALPYQQQDQKQIKTTHGTAWGVEQANDGRSDLLSRSSQIAQAT